MDRLTEYFHGRHGDFANIKALKTNAGGYAACDAVCKKGRYDCEKCEIADAVARLAAYEDTGLSPEEITALKRERDDWFRRYNELMLNEGSRP